MRLEPDSFLGRVLEHKRQEVALRKRALPPEELRQAAAQAPPPRDLLAALRAPGVRIIAEIKPRSPSAGDFADPLGPARRAMAYEKGGAAAISVLTDARHFGGSLAGLMQARAAAGLPVLCKDFVIDPHQLYAARAAGADGVLLIAAALDPGLLSDLHGLALELGLTPLVEVHQMEELAGVLALEPDLVGVNNRHLGTLVVDLETSVRLRTLIPAGVTMVSESGVSGPAQIKRLTAVGVRAFLVGTALMRAPDPAAALAGLRGEEAA